MEARTMVETTELMALAGSKKFQEGPIIQFLKACVGGILLSFGGTLALSAGSSPELQTDNPGLGRIIPAVIFPIGLIMIVLLGQELVTSTMMTMVWSIWRRRIPFWAYPAYILVQFFGNLVGCLFYTAIYVHWSGILGAAAFNNWVQTFATTKFVTAEAYEIFLRGIGCNMLVCIGVFLAAQSKDNISRVVVIALPIFLFVGVGFDHVVANMFFAPLAIMQGSKTLTTAHYITNSMLPSLAGNFVGAWMVAFPFGLFYLSRFGAPADSGAGNFTEADVEANGIKHPIGSGMEKGMHARVRPTSGSPEGTIVN